MKNETKILTLSELTESTSLELIQQIYEINETNKTIKKPNPITLIINTEGGDIGSGIGLTEVIRNSHTPIHTICYGTAWSMGLLILASGKKRSMGKYSTAMYHECVWKPGNGNIHLHTQELERGKTCQSNYESILFQLTKITHKDINRRLNNSREWLLNAEECLEYDIIDTIIPTNI